MAGTQVDRVERLLGLFADGQLSREKLIAELGTVTRAFDNISKTSATADKRTVKTTRNRAIDVRIDQLVDAIDKFISQKQRPANPEGRLLV